MPRFWRDGEPVDPRDVLDNEELAEYEQRRREDIRNGAIKFNGRVGSSEDPE